MPTILELAGLEVHDVVQFPSLVPLLEGKKDKLHDFVVNSWPINQSGDLLRVVDDIEREVIQTMPSKITNGEWTLIYAETGALVELYYNVSDPKQEKNVAEEHDDTAQDLHEKFISFLERTHTEEVILKPRRNLR